MTAKMSAIVSKPQGKAPRTRQTSSRIAILNAAIDLFGRSDLDSVTIRDLEEKSGVAAPTIYHFFGDKRRLYDEAIKASFEQVNRDIMGGIGEITDDEEALRQLTNKYIRVFSQNTMFTRVFLRQLQSEDTLLLKDLTAEMYVPAYQHWQTLLNRIRPGAGDGLLPLMIISMLLGTGSLALVRQLAPYPAKPGTKKENEAIVQLMLCIIRSPEVGAADIEPRKAGRRKQPALPIGISQPEAAARHSAAGD